MIVIINHYTSTESVQTSHVPAKLMDQTISLSTDKKDIKTVKLVLVKIVASLLSTISGLLSWHESNFLPNCSRYESLTFPNNHHWQHRAHLARSASDLKCFKIKLTQKLNSNGCFKMCDLFTLGNTNLKFGEVNGNKRAGLVSGTRPRPTPLSNT